MEQNNPDISISIVSWNTRDLLDQCLESVYNTTKGIEFEVIVVDNASSDDSAMMVTAKYPQVKLIQNNENVGFARANNQAYRISNGRHFMLLNPDTIAVTDLSPIVEFLDNNAEVGVASCKCLNPDKSIQPNWYDYYPSFIWELLPEALRNLASKLIFNRNPSSNFATKWVGGQCMTVRRACMDNVDGMDQDFFMYSEETDLCFRIKKLGKKIMHFSGITIVHIGGQSTKSVQSKMLIELYRSKSHFIRKNFSNLHSKLFKMGLMIRTCLLRTVVSATGDRMNRSARINQLNELLNAIRDF